MIVMDRGVKPLAGNGDFDPATISKPRFDFSSAMEAGTAAAAAAGEKKIAGVEPFRRGGGDATSSERAPLVSRLYIGSDSADNDPFLGGLWLWASF